MGYIKLIGAFFSIIKHFLDLRKEKNKEMAKKKAENVIKIVTALSEVNPVQRDRAVLDVLDDINRM